MRSGNWEIGAETFSCEFDNANIPVRWAVTLWKYHWKEMESASFPELRVCIKAHMEF